MNITDKESEIIAAAMDSSASPEDFAKFKELSEVIVMRNFEGLVEEHPELLNISEGERQMLEKLASHSGTSFRMELAKYLTGRAIYESVRKDLRAKRVKVKRSDLIPKGEAHPPAGIDDVIPPELIESDTNDAPL
jgi:hypothetical protein